MGLNGSLGWWAGLLAAVWLGTASADVNVVALNIEWFPGQKTRPETADVERHIAETRDVMAELAPDLLIATEICDETALREALASVPGMDLHVISNFALPEDDGVERRNQQIAIASRYFALAAWAEPWAATMDHLRRGFAFAALRNPHTGRLILVYGVHLKSNRSSTPEEEQINYDVRNESIDQLLEHMEYARKKFEHHGIDGWIVAGDYNTNHDGRFGDRVVEKLTEAGFWNSWINVPPEERHTWKGRGNFEPTTFDYIMTKGLGEADAHLVVTPETISDHNAVVLDITLPRPPPVDEPPAASP